MLGVEMEIKMAIAEKQGFWFWEEQNIAYEPHKGEGTEEEVGEEERKAAEDGLSSLGEEREPSKREG